MWIYIQKFLYWQLVNYLSFHLIPFRFVRWIVCPQSSFVLEVCEKKVHRFGPHRFRVFIQRKFWLTSNWFFLNRYGHVKFQGVSWSVINLYVLRLVLYLCRKKGKNWHDLQQKQKKVATGFLEICHLMNIDPNPMILIQELDPVYTFVCSFLHEISNLPHF